MPIKKEKKCGLKHTHDYYSCCAACMHGEHPSEGASGHVKNCKYFTPSIEEEEWEVQFDKRFGKDKERTNNGLFSMKGWTDSEVKQFIKSLLLSKEEEIKDLKLKLWESNTLKK